MIGDWLSYIRLNVWRDLMNKGMKKWSLIALLLSGVTMPATLEAKTVMKAAPKASPILDP
jgi:hypothetical protein